MQAPHLAVGAASLRGVVKLASLAYYNGDRLRRPAPEAPPESCLPSRGRPSARPPPTARGRIPFRRLLADQPRRQQGSISLSIVPHACPPSSAPLAAARGQEEGRRFHLVARREGAEAFRPRLHHQSPARVRHTPAARASLTPGPQGIVACGEHTGQPAQCGRGARCNSAAGRVFGRPPVVREWHGVRRHLAQFTEWRSAATLAKRVRLKSHTTHRRLTICRACPPLSSLPSSLIAHPPSSSPSLSLPLAPHPVARA